jgi:CheY-like chemotaxis protein
MKPLCVIIEANPFIALLLQRYAENFGLDVITVQVGEDAFEVVSQKMPAVIVIDPEMPGKMRGWDIIRLLSSEPQTCQIPVIACTCLDQAELREKTGAVSGRLEKPEIHYQDFVSALRQAGISE